MTTTLRALCCATLAAAAARPVELDPSNYAAAVDGRKVMVLFRGRSVPAALERDWARLAEAFDDDGRLVASVDCGKGGAPICAHMDITSTTIAWGDPWDLKPYSGGPSYAALAAHVETSMAPDCGAGARRALCTAAERALLDTFEALSAAELDARIMREEARTRAATMEIQGEWSARTAPLEGREHAYRTRHRKTVEELSERLSDARKVLAGRGK